MHGRLGSKKERTIKLRNRANARGSTGPRSTAGKARSSQNALVHGLRCEGERDAAETEDRLTRAEVLGGMFEPEDAFE